jgi:hypothetical protein
MEEVHPRYRMRQLHYQQLRMQWLNRSCNKKILDVPVLLVAGIFFIQSLKSLINFPNPVHLSTKDERLETQDVPFQRSSTLGSTQYRDRAHRDKTNHNI